MIFWASLLTAFGALLLQMVSAPLYELRGAVPDLALIVVAYVGLFGPRSEAMLTAFIAGLLCDLTSLDPWPTHLARLLLATHFITLGATEGWGVRLMSRTLLFTGIAALSAAVHASLVWVLEDIELRLEVQALSMIYTVLLSLPAWHLMAQWTWFQRRDTHGGRVW